MERAGGLKEPKPFEAVGWLNARSEEVKEKKIACLNIT